MDCKSEKSRLHTFAKWTLTNPSASELASLGFCHVTGNQIYCIFCNSKATCKEGDLGLKLHLDSACKNGGCVFLQSYKILKSENSWCDWSYCLSMSVPEKKMSIFWDACEKFRNDAITQDLCKSFSRLNTCD